MPLDKRNTDGLIVSLMDMKNQSTIKLAREIADTPVIFDVHEPHPTFWDLLDNRSREMWRRMCQNIRKEVFNVLLISNGDPDSFEVDLEVAREIELVGMEVVSGANWRAGERLRLRGDKPSSFQIVDMTW